MGSSHPYTWSDCLSINDGFIKYRYMDTSDCMDDGGVSIYIVHGPSHSKLSENDSSAEKQRQEMLHLVVVVYEHLIGILYVFAS